LAVEYSKTAQGKRSGDEENDESAWMRGCRFKVYSGKVEMGKMPEKYDQVHILNSSSRRKQQ
jgi:hypothetical protein